MVLADVNANYYVEDVKPHAFDFATSVMAGVIAWWQMEWPLQGDLSCGRCYCHGS